MNSSGLLKYPRPQAKTGVCSARWSVRLGILSRWTKLFLRGEFHGLRFSSQEGVEVVKKKSLRNEFLNGCIRGVRLSTCSKISHRESVEAVEHIPQERNSVRRCEQSEMIDVTKISSLEDEG